VLGRGSGVVSMICGADSILGTVSLWLARVEKEIGWFMTLYDRVSYHEQVRAHFARGEGFAG
jgi:hypothetical protein